MQWRLTAAHKTNEQSSEQASRERGCQRIVHWKSTVGHLLGSQYPLPIRSSRLMGLPQIAGTTNAREHEVDHFSSIHQSSTPTYTRTTLTVLPVFVGLREFVLRRKRRQKGRRNNNAIHTDETIVNVSGRPVKSLSSGK